MILYPAIDIRGGRAVRLVQGDYERETAYDADPAEAARRWADGGAAWLHVVDLDGARAGEPANLDAVARIAEAVDVPLQLGGGIRDGASATRLLEAGASRVILGTAAMESPELVASLVQQHGADAIVVSVDARRGKVAVAGWERPTDTFAEAAVTALADHGACRFVFTPVEVDGTLEGPGLDAAIPVAEAAAAASCELIYSGGVGTLDDLRALAELGARTPALAGAIVGRALYEERFTVEEAISALGADQREES